MIRPQDCEILQWSSFDDEAAFFASMGRFFASARVRRECGGYPLSDGPYHRWFVLWGGDCFDTCQKRDG